MERDGLPISFLGGGGVGEGGWQLAADQLAAAWKTVVSTLSLTYPLSLLAPIPIVVCVYTLCVIVENTVFLTAYI